MTSWRSTWKPNSLHTMASDPPAMNHPSDVLTIRCFVRLAWIFTPLCCACARKTKYIFGQVHQGEQSLKPSHHRHYELRLRSPNPSWSAISSTKSPRRPRIAPTQPALVPPLRRQGRGLIHIFDLFAMLQSRYEYFLYVILILSFCVYIYTLHTFLLWPHYIF